MRFSIVVLCFIVFLFNSCQFPEKKTEEKSIFIKEINLLNDSIYRHIRAGRAANVLRLMPSNVAKEVRADMYQWVKEVRPFFQNENYKVLENFHLLNDEVGVVKTLSSTAKDERKFSMQYKVISKEMYISLLLPDDFLSQPLLTILYTKNAGKWKLSTMQVGQYAYIEMTAAHFYKRAKAAYSKHNLLNANGNLYLLSKCFQPGGQSWKYLQHEEIIGFYKMIMDSVNKTYQFPMIIDAKVSKAYVQSVVADVFEYYVLPVVYYHSDINIRDTAQLRKEYNYLNSTLRFKLRELYIDNKAVVYRAYNNLQDSSHLNFESFGFMDVVNQMQGIN